MNSFIDALQAKIDEIEEAREAAVQEFDTKLELLRELMESEGETPTSKVKASSAKRGPGRPKGAKGKKTVAGTKHAPKDEIYEEAMKQVARLEEGGTSPELQKSRTASFNPTPRPQTRTDPNVHAGTKQQMNAARAGAGKVDANVSVDESDLEDD